MILPLASSALLVLLGCTSTSSNPPSTNSSCELLPVPVTALRSPDEFSIVPKWRLALVINFANRRSLDGFMSWFDSEWVTTNHDFLYLMRGVTMAPADNADSVLFDFDPNSAVGNDVCALYAALRSHLSDTNAIFVQQ